MDDEIIRHIRSRIERCRRLAQATTDGEAARVLAIMAEEGEADLARLLSDRPGQGGANGPIILT